MTPELETLKSRLRSTWIAGDFGQIAKSYTDSAAQFVSQLNLQPGTKLLDVACGTGNLSLPAARFGADVTGVDIAPNLLQQAQESARTEGLNAKFEEGDAEALQYKDESFDVVATMFGAMFAPRPEVVAAELVRVCKHGGKIAMANWTPTGFVGRMFKTISAHVSPPPGMQPPVLWGVEETVRQRFGSSVSSLQATPADITFRFPSSPQEFVEHFRTYYGPTQKAFASLDQTGQDALRRDLEKLYTESNRAQDGTTEIISQYLQVIATRP